MTPPPRKRERCRPSRRAREAFAALAGLLALLPATAATPTQEPDPEPDPENGGRIGFFYGDLTDLAHPTAVALDSQGRAWVAEAARNGLARFDGTGALELRIALDDIDPRALPAGVAVGPAGRLFLTDANDGRVHVLDAEGAHLASFGTPGVQPGELHRPSGIEVGHGRVAVANTGNHRVELFDLEGAHLFGLGGHGREEGRFIRPADVAFDAEGRIYVADQGNDRVQVFEADGRFARAWGDSGPFPGLFAGPAALEVRAGEVFVCDRSNHRIQVFDLEGRHVYEWGEHAIRPGQGEGKLHYPAGLAVSSDGGGAVVVETIDQRCQVFGDSAERGTGERLVPTFGAVTASEHYGGEVAASGDWMAISSPEGHSVLLFETSWKEPRLVSHVGDLGDRPGLMRHPAGLFLDAADGTLVVTDRDLRRVSIFRVGAFEDGQVGYDLSLTRFVKSLDLARLHALSLAEHLEAIPDPGAVTRDARGHLFVCDLRNDRVLELDAGLSFVRSFGGRGSAPGELREPTGLALAPGGGTLYVVDAGNARVQLVELERFEVRAELRVPGSVGRPGLCSVVVTGDEVLVTDAWQDCIHVFGAHAVDSAVERIGASGLGMLQFRQPRGLAAYHDGLVVIDHANHRGQILGPDREYAGIFGSRPFIVPVLQEVRRREQGDEQGEQDGDED